MTCKFASNLLPDSGILDLALLQSQNPWIGGDLAASEMMRKKPGESWSFGLPPLGDSGYFRMLFI